MSSVIKIPMTPEGYNKMREELKRLRTQERPKIVKEIEEARALGDLSENAEYHSAKEKQGLLEAKIREVEDKIGRAEVIDVTKQRSDRIIFGATVTLLDLNSDEEFVYKIVGDDESDISVGLMSINSPLAKGLIGKREGEEVIIPTPGGKREVEVLKIEYK